MILVENFEVFVSLILLIIMIVFFVTEIVPIEVTALSTAVLMVILGILPSKEFLNILSNPAPWTIICMFVLSGALVRTGVLDKVGDFISSNTINGKFFPNTILSLKSNKDIVLEIEFNDINSNCALKNLTSSESNLISFLFVLKHKFNLSINSFCCIVNFDL